MAKLGSNERRPGRASARRVSAANPAAEQGGGSSTVAAAEANAGEARLVSVCCYNYRTQLVVAGQLIADALAAGRGPALVLGDDAETALDTLETLGFAFRQALLERRLDVYTCRDDACGRALFRRDYDRLLDEALNRPAGGSEPVIVTGFDALFDAAERAAIEPQIVDLVQAIDERGVAVHGLYVPASWARNDALGECLSAALGEGGLRYAAPGGEDGEVAPRAGGARANPDDAAPGAGSLDASGIAA